MNEPEKSAPPNWEREVLEKLAFAALEESRKTRRWGLFFKLFIAVYMVVLLLLAQAGSWNEKPFAGRYTALIEIEGVIAPDSDASADNVITALRSAFEDKAVAGVILRSNSPGGSPVQSGLIFDEIRRLRAKHADTPLYAVIEEVGASGGYYVAAAADRIYVDKASLVGSIGVLMGGFGFVDAMDKVGVERRLLTAGDKKGFLDSFSPVSEAQRAHAQRMLDQVHAQFIAKVREGRADRLAEDPDLFSGLVWTGERSVELGLADGLGSVASVARDVIKAEDIVDFSPRQNLAEKLARRVGASAGETLARVLGVEASGWSLR